MRLVLPCSIGADCRWRSGSEFIWLLGLFIGIDHRFDKHGFGQEFEKPGLDKSNAAEIAGLTSSGRSQQNASAPHALAKAIDRRGFAAIFGIAYLSLLKPDLGKAFFEENDLDRMQNLASSDIVRISREPLSSNIDLCMQTA